MASEATMKPGFGTEYTENYCWDLQKARYTADAAERSKRDTGLFGTNLADIQPGYVQQGIQTGPVEHPHLPPERDLREFPSQKYPSIFRETIVRKDESFRGKYVDPFNTIGTSNYGRRLMYDDTHPDKIYGSQWSSELADPNGCYSFPTTTGLAPEIPWCKDIQWRKDGEVGKWPTELWKDWTKAAACPTYDGHDDQVKYSQYKTTIPGTTDVILNASKIDPLWEKNEMTRPSGWI